MLYFYIGAGSFFAGVVLSMLYHQRIVGELQAKLAEIHDMCKTFLDRDAK